MGLDAVEIIIETEEAFGITIADDEAEKLFKVRDLYNLVLSKIDTSPACASSIAFYRVRQAMVESLGVSRRSVRPSTRLESLLPQKNRREAWKQVEDAAKLTLPRLQYTAQWKSRFIAAGLISATLAILMVWRLVTFLSPSFVLSGVTFFVGASGWIAIFGITAGLLDKRATFLRNQLPCSSAGDLAMSMLALNQAEFSLTAEAKEKLTREDLWVRLVKIICKQLGLEPHEVVPEARFVEDLGVS